MSSLRWYFFAVYLGPGALLPLLALNFEARGLSPSQYAWLIASLPLARLLAPPLWGALADRWLGTARLLSLNTLLCGIAMLALCRTVSLPTLVIAVVAWSVFSASLMPLAEAGALFALAERGGSYAWVRVFGSLGFAVTALGMGAFGPFENVSAPFWVGAFGYLAALPVSLWRMPSAPATRSSIAPVLRALAARRDVWLLWLGSTFYYMGHGVYDAYYGPHIKRIEGVTQATVSLAWAVGVVAEIVVMLAVPRLLRARSSGSLLVVTAGVAVVRFLCIAFASTPLWVWLAQPAHAVTFGVWYLAFVEANRAAAPAALRATSQGMVQACLGSGMLVSAVAGGYLAEALGTSALFVLAAGCALLGGLCYAARAAVAGPLLRA